MLLRSSALGSEPSRCCHAGGEEIIRRFAAALQSGEQPAAIEQSVQPESLLKRSGLCRVIYSDYAQPF